MDTSTVRTRVDSLGRRLAPRQHRSLEDKLQIIAEARSAGSVAAVARKHGVNANLIFAWMRHEEQGLLRTRTRRTPARLLAVAVRPEPAREPEPAGAAPEPGRLEVALADGISLGIVGDAWSVRSDRSSRRKALVLQHLRVPVRRARCIMSACRRTPSCSPTTSALPRCCAIAR
jgi:transposase-like protein